MVSPTRARLSSTTPVGNLYPPHPTVTSTFSLCIEAMVTKPEMDINNSHQELCLRAPGLLKMPNEILNEIAANIPATSELEPLKRVNYYLYDFVKDHLRRYRYGRGLTSLPDNVLLQIAGYMAGDTVSNATLYNWSTTEWYKPECGQMANLSMLAQVSWRFYPVLTEEIIHHNIRYHGNQLLNYAVGRDLRHLAKRITRLGGTDSLPAGELQGTGYTWLPPPFNYPDVAPSCIWIEGGSLALAASRGHVEMCRILLEKGANQFISGFRFPLAFAIFNRKEEVAMILSKHLDSHDVSPDWSRSWSTLLQMACEEKLVKLVRYFLELPSRNPWEVAAHVLDDRSIALCRLLQMDTSDIPQDFVRRDIHNATFEIVTLLLKHGANPDFLCIRRSPNPLNPWRHKEHPPVSARAVAKTHPDPRVRVLIASAPEQANSNARGGQTEQIWNWSEHLSTESPDSPRDTKRFHKIRSQVQTESPEPSRIKTVLEPHHFPRSIVGGLVEGGQRLDQDNGKGSCESAQILPIYSKLDGQISAAQFWATRTFWVPNR